MPEFVMPLGEQQTWQCLDDFTQGYWEAVFFTNAYDSEDECNGMTFADVAKDAYNRAIDDCKAFQQTNRADLDEAIDNGRINGYDATAAGRDFWYTRCGHGVGFWDRDLGEVGDKLFEACKAWGNIDVVCGDDGKLYLEGDQRAKS